jgi:hypothetical protein
MMWVGRVARMEGGGGGGEEEDEDKCIEVIGG